MAARLVIADDNEGIRFLLRVLVELDGRMTVVGEAADGLQAVSLVVSERPDLLLLDLSMPVLDGLQVLGEIRAAGIELKTLVYSGFTAGEVRTAALAAGACDVLVKGVPPESIVNRLAEL
jgi:DNA-binding NarL/FixJ family response regulator